jgi:uncharacterized phage infection (PIP) family protein YhgE
MSNADVFRSLAQDMASAFEERTERIGEIKKEAADLLEGFHKAHSEMSAQLKSGLARGEAERKKVSQAEAKERGEEVAKMREEVADLLEGFHKAHSEMSAQLKSELARGEAERKKVSQAEAKERTKRIAEIKKETADLLEGFDKAHSEMSAQLKSELARGEAERKKVSQAEAEERTKRIAEIKKETADLLKGFDKAHSEMSAQLKSELAKGEAERKKVSQAEAKERREGVRQLREGVRQLLEAFRKDSRETAAAWRDLVATMQAKRGVIPPLVKPPVAEVPVEEVVPVEEARLEEKILALIKEHPEGIKLAEISARTGVAKIRAGKIVRMLQDEGEIGKEGLLYFPV